MRQDVVENFRDKTIHDHGLIQQNHTGVIWVIFEEKANQNTGKENIQALHNNTKSLNTETSSFETFYE